MPGFPKQNVTLDTNHKKAGITILLALACLACIILLFSYDPAEHERLPTLSEVDSLIYDELSLFNIQGEQIRENRVEVDTLFERKNFRVGLPPGLSRTFVHTELARRINERGYTTRGKVDFPDRNITVEIIRDETLVRRVYLQQDTTFHRTLQPASVLVYFNSTPEDSHIDQLLSIGKPIGILLKGTSAEDLTRRYEQIREYPHLTGFWPVEADGYESERAEELAQELHSIQASPVILSLTEDFHSGQSDAENIQWIYSRNATLTSREHGRQAFDENLRDFGNKAMRGQQPILIVSGSEKTLNWLEESIYDLKKGGIVLTTPPLSED